MVRKKEVKGLPGKSAGRLKKRVPTDYAETRAKKAEFSQAEGQGKSDTLPKQKK